MVATSAGGCTAQTAPATVTVTNPPPVCPVIASYSASSASVVTGSQVTISWNVQNAANVTFEGAAVAATGSQTFTLTADRTFTLTASDAGNTCPVTQTITVRATAAPPACAFPAPQIQSFGANPSSIATGASSNLAWNVTGLQPGGTVTLTGNGLNQTVSASGNQTVTPPNASGNYTYNLTATNVCSDGSLLTTQAPVVITVAACPSPAIDSFTVNPSTVTQGGNQRITFSWSISGTVDAVSIDNGVGGNLPASGSVDVPQPATTTTYTITVVGCGVTRTAQVTVTVSVCPPPVFNSFSASQGVVTAGGNQTIRLAWNQSGTASSTSIDNGVGNVTGQSFIDIPQPQVTTTYTITSTGCGQSASAQVTVAVAACPVPSINSFTTNPNSVVAGGNQTVRLAWTLSGSVTSVSIDNGVGNVSGQSFVDIAQPQQTTTYTITASGCGGTQTRNVTVTVSSCPVPSINSFTANPNSVTAGGSQTIQLAWDAASSCSATVSIDNGVGSNLPLSGAVNIAQPQATTTYTLTVSSPGGTQTRQAPVTVNNNPPPSDSCSVTSKNHWFCDANTNVDFEKDMVATITDFGGGNYTVNVPAPEFAGSYTALFQSGSFRITTSSGTVNYTYSNLNCSPSATNYCYDANGQPIGGRVFPQQVGVTSSSGVSVRGSYEFYRGDGCDAAGNRLYSARFEADTNNCVPELQFLGKLINPTDNFLEYAKLDSHFSFGKNFLKQKTCKL